MGSIGSTRATRRLTCLGLGVVALVLAVSSCVGATPASKASSTHASTSSESTWTTFGGSDARDSLQRVDAPAPHLRQVWARPLGGAVYGEPLIDDGRVFAATEGDRVVALSETTGAVIWSTSLGAAVPASLLPCGDIAPTVGVTSTMVIDPQLARVFVSASVLVAGTVHHELFALGLAKGQVLFERDLDQPGWSAPAQLQRGALTLAGGRILIGFGGNDGDCAEYHGYEMSVPATGHGPTLVYRVPTAREGAIWGVSGTAVNSAGDAFVATGNGSSDTTFDYGDAVIELTSTMKVKSVFAPGDFAQLNEGDLDLGSTAPILLPGGRLFEIGKGATGYLLDQDQLGGVGARVPTITVCTSRGASAYADGLILVSCPDTGMEAVRLSGSTMTIAWRAAASVTGPATVGGTTAWEVANGELVGLSLGSGTVLDEVAAPETEHFATPSVAAGMVVVGGTDSVVAYRG